MSRNASGTKAQTLSAAGIEVVTANGWDGAALVKAFQGCWAVFINIDSDNPVSSVTHIFPVLMTDALA